MHQIVGNGSKAREVAAEVVELLGTPDENDFWATATLAEAYLLQKKNKEAAHYYAQAASISTGKYGQLNSTYSQLLLLKHYLQIPGEIMGLFLPPGIAAFTGHMIDHNRSIARFPESIEDQVAKQIRIQLSEHQISIGYTSLACGSDILFAEALIEIGGEVNVFLPFAKEDFLKTSVSFAGDHWVERFNKVLESCQLHYITEERYFNDSVLFDFLGKVIIGAAVLRGSLMHTDPYLLSVQSTKDLEMKVGGTRSVIDLWPFASRHININTDVFLPVAQTEVAMSEVQNKEEGEAETEMEREVRYIMFADIVGFSKWEEEQTPQFMLVLLKEMSEQLADYPKPNILNTWGDSIFVVYGNAKYAVEFGMKVRNIFTKTNWEKDGLPKDLSIRIALHAGPVFVGKDPLTKRMNVYGSHINRAARMEPVAIPGLIYASNQFASALVAEAPGEYDLNHVGIISLAKDYGTQEVYLIEKAKESNS
jgi:class 3 adenylate cyclase